MRVLGFPIHCCAGKVQPTCKVQTTWINIDWTLDQVLASSTASELEKEARDAIMSILVLHESLFKDKHRFDGANYKICDSVFAPLSGRPNVTPSNVVPVIQELIQQLGRFSCRP